MNDFKPILACDADLNALDKLPFPMAGFLKYDGVRVIHHNGFYGRSMKLHKNPHLQQVFNRPDFFGFDSEGLVTAPGDPRACTLTSGAFSRQKDKPKEGKVIAVDATCYVFDDFSFPGHWALRYENAMRRLDRILKADPNAPVRPFPYRLIESLDQLQEFEAEADAGNHEGLILRSLFGPYKYGRCTAKEGYYLRIKRFEDREFIIEACEEGFTNTNEAKVDPLGHTERSTKKEGMVANGQIASFLGRDLETDKPVKVSSGKLTVAEATEGFKRFNELYKGQIGKYQVFNKGTGNFAKPRFPTFQSLRSKEDL